MPKYSVSSMFFHEYSCEEIFSFAEDAGCNALEFWPETPDFWLNGKREENILNLIDQYPDLTPLTIHAPVLDLNPCSVNPDVAEVSIKNTLEAIYLAEKLKAAVVTIHPGRRTAKRPAGRRDMERFERYIRKVELASKETGIRIALENMPPKINSLFSKPGDMRDILEQEEWLYFTFDIAHALVGSEEETLEFLETSYERIINIHLSKNSGEISHYPIENDHQTGSILMKLSEMNYNGHLTLEIEDLNFGRRMTSDEKISVIKNDLDFIKKFFQ